MNSKWTHLSALRTWAGLDIEFTSKYVRRYGLYNYSNIQTHARTS